jgi:hypothetical protein
MSVKERRKLTDDEIAERPGKLEHFNAEVTGLPEVKRDSHGVAKTAVIPAKARFKGAIVVTIKGDVASAYWSVTPGMTIRVGAVSMGKNEYDAETLEVVPQAS